MHVKVTFHLGALGALFLLARTEASLCSFPEMLTPSVIAGYYCRENGAANGQDSNDGVSTSASCAETGGEWTAYTCNAADDYFSTLNDGQKRLKRWWGPKCCEGSVCPSPEMLSPSTIAGYNCWVNGVRIHHSYMGVTSASCADDGGEWLPYTCTNVENHLSTLDDVDRIKWLKREWWGPVCCETKTTLCPSPDMFTPSTIAGYTCKVNGVSTGQDSNDGVSTSGSCTDRGGEWTAYTCSNADDYLSTLNDLQTAEWLKSNWWGPRCCEGSLCPSREMLSPSTISGYNCGVNGVLIGHSDDGVTTSASCADDGGEWLPYTCANVDDYLSTVDDVDDIKWLKGERWGSKCCDRPLCPSPDMFTSFTRAGYYCRANGAANGQDSNDGHSTSASCAESGGEWLPYTCQNADDYLSTLDDLQHAERLKRNYWGQTCCQGSICPSSDMLIPSNNAGYYCRKNGVSIQDSNDGVSTSASCAESGGEWLPYTCKNADDHLSTRVDIEGVEWLKENNWWAVKCCEAALCPSPDMFTPSVIAGYTCKVNGVSNGQDSNDGVSTSGSCAESGGEWLPYTCQNVDDYLSTLDDLQTIERLKNDWWSPRCCEGSLCPSPEMLSPSTIAGYNCWANDVVIGHSHDGVTTSASCADDGGEWSPYTCAGVDNWLSMLDDVDLIKSLKTEWWGPVCCSTALCPSPDMFTPSTIAGYDCKVNGVSNGQDSNDGVSTSASCAESGGEWTAYTCATADDYLSTLDHVETRTWPKRNWWSAKCCQASLCPSLDMLVPSNIAGYTCLANGLPNGQNSNDGGLSTSASCTYSGGEWRAYTCTNAEAYLSTLDDSMTVWWLKNSWWGQKCCEAPVGSTLYMNLTVPVH